jgi:hypothetical protein
MTAPAFAALAAVALAPAPARRPARSRVRTPFLARLAPRVPGGRWAAAGASAIALIVLGVSVAQAGSPAPAAAGSLKTAKIGGVTVLTNAEGFTLYSFAPDTPAKSNCNGSCAATPTKCT